MGAALHGRAGGHRAADDPGERGQPDLGRPHWCGASMSLSKRGKWIMWTSAAACVLGFALLWNPFARPSLERSVVVVPPAPGVQAPAGKDDVLTILYSGDGGWADLDKQLGTVFATRGIPVLGINSFKYF
ncbi:MAG TPA: AcvB/VirJ family lysyl-phosphatidylglycerol hydrolase, partial [Rhodanobacteraceae bacterium]|nr:AcvB/VirJ family lysyl-phosphatidylglycerol hydrolase [Rhodanobacteraceae bacterium]